MASPRKPIKPARAGGGAVGILRPMREIVELVLAVAIAICLVIIPIGMVAVQITVPAVDLSSVLDSYVSLLGVVVGAVVGYLAGKVDSRGSTADDDRDGTRGSGGSTRPTVTGDLM